MNVFVLETFDNSETNGVCGVFDSKEAAINGAVAMVARSWLDFEGLFFLIAEMRVNNDNHTFDKSNVYRFSVKNGKTVDVVFYPSDGWAEKVVA